MTNVCPQCKYPVPRESSRFCNQCGFDLQALSVKLAEPGLSGSHTVEFAVKSNEEVVSNSSYLADRPSNKVMVASQDDTKPQKPDATLHILLRDGSVTERDLINDETRLGKGPQNDIILADASVSGSHAIISFDHGAYSLSDLGSRNGTFLNDGRVTEPRPLHHGDLIKMGHCTITFRLKEAGDTLSMNRTQLLDATQPPPPPIPPPVPKPTSLTEDGLAEALISSGLVAQSEVERLRGAGSKGRRLFRALLEEKLVTEIGLRDLMSRTFNVSPIEPNTMDVDASAAVALRQKFLRDKLVCPVIGQAADRLTIAVADPTDKSTIDEIERITKKKASIRLAVPSEIIARIDSYFTPRLIGVTSSGEKIEGMLNQVETEIGKATHNRIVITDPTVSNTHAIVLVRDGGYGIIDLGSSNGTFVNGQLLGNDAVTLQHGDKIQLGQVVLTFRNPAETTENKTARLSLEALEEVRKRAGLRLPPTGARTDPTASHFPQGGLVLAPPAHPATIEDEDERKEKKKKKKEKNSWFSPNALSRILAQVLGAAVTLFGSYYLVTRSLQRDSSPPPSSSSKGEVMADKLSAPSAWKSFSTGLFGSTVEASGVAFVPGTNGVIFVSDNRESEVLWMQIDEDGKQVGSIKTIPLGVSFKDPESITYGNSSFYMVTSQSDPKDGPRNALVRFDFNPETQALRGQAEIVSDLRSFLLSNVSEIASLGASPGAQGGLNIEGIAWDPNHERLLLGLRSPLIGNQAVLIPLKLRDPRGAFNIENLKVDDPRVIVLSLEGHGVRDITYDTRLKNFLVVSGAPENVPKTDFVLWEWTGQPDSRPVKLMALDDKMKPEGLTSTNINGLSFVFVVGDAGSYSKLNYLDAK